jgi:hypothetical protein
MKPGNWKEINVYKFLHVSLYPFAMLFILIVINVSQNNNLNICCKLIKLFMHAAYLIQSSTSPIQYHKL